MNQAEYEAFVRGAFVCPQSDAAPLRGATLFRGLLANRGHGRAGQRHPGVWSDGNRSVLSIRAIRRRRRMQWFSYAPKIAITRPITVGFQTRLAYPEQKRIFAMIPALAHAEFIRYGSIHRNSYVEEPQSAG